MENTLNDRLKIFIEYIKISDVDLGRKTGNSKQQVGSWFNSGVKVPVTALSLIIKEYSDLNARWLLTGEGDMLISEGKSIIYKINETTADISAEKITTYSCKDCISKQREINALTLALEAKEELLEKYREDAKRK